MLGDLRRLSAVCKFFNVSLLFVYMPNATRHTHKLAVLDDFFRLSSVVGANRNWIH